MKVVLRYREERVIKDIKGANSTRRIPMMDKVSAARRRNAGRVLWRLLFVLPFVLAVSINKDNMSMLSK
jgi:hypothetical protein